jgi:hypothetical protein
MRWDKARRQLNGPASASHGRPTAHSKRNDRKHEKYKEKDLRDACGGRRDPEETQHSSDESNHEKNGSPVKHGSLLILTLSAFRMPSH